MKLKLDMTDNFIKKNPPETRTCRVCGEGKDFILFTSCASCHWGRSHTCQACTKSRLKEYHKKWYEKNKKAKLAQNRQWTVNNKDKVEAYLKNDYHQRDEVKLEKTIRRAEQRAKRLGLTVSLSKTHKNWLRTIYRRRQLMTKLYETPYEVDHIYPLSKGGLHVPWNLQIITRTDNRKKSTQEK